MILNEIKKRLKKALIPKDKLLVFNFHQSTPVFNPKIHGQYTWTSLDLLEKNIVFLKQNFLILPIKKAIDLLKSGKIKGTCISVTFDDGDLSLQDHIVPLFEKYQFAASFYINSLYLQGKAKGYWFNIYNSLASGNEDQKSILTNDIKDIASKLRNTTDQGFYREGRAKIEKLQEYLDQDNNFYVSRSFLENLNSELFSIGLHGHEHQRFSMMPADWQKKDLEINIEHLSKFKSYIPVFALPFGKLHDWEPTILTICKQLELEVLFANGGYNTCKNFQEGILRIPADGLEVKKFIENL